MSRTYSLICFETKKELHVGQGHAPDDIHIYSADEHQESLAQFLIEHIGKPIYLLDDEIIGDLLATSDEHRQGILAGKNGIYGCEPYWFDKDGKFSYG